MGKPAARVGDLTAHGGTIVGPGCPTVLIGGMPAAQIGNMHVCPMVTPGVPPIPHVGGPIVGPVPPTVLIGGMPAACVGDMCICVGPPATILPPGCLTVLIGQACGGMGGGGGGPGGAPGQAMTPSSVSSVKGIQTQGAQGQSQGSQQQQQQSQQQQQQASQKSKPPFTLKDIVEILKQIESSEGYEAARFFAGHLDYGVLTSMAMSGEPDNDPNQMPTRFMLLFGADDAKLQVIDEHPDNFPNQPKHPINVANLRKALRLLGYDVKETGPYDKQVYIAHLQYMASHMRAFSSEALQELHDGDDTQDHAAQKAPGEKLAISLGIGPGDPEAQDDAFTLFSTDSQGTYKQVKTVKDDADPGNDTLDLVFTGLDKSLSYTLEINLGASGGTQVLFKDRPFGKWFQYG